MAESEQAQVAMEVEEEGGVAQEEDGAGPPGDSKAGESVQTGTTGAQHSCDMQEKEEDEEEKMCRFCFEETEPLEADICACRGGQRYVHLDCLRRWQRMVLVSQPTHPSYYEKDKRQHICNVCNTEFTCAPPTRLELMQSFTGAEVAQLIAQGSFIAAKKEFSEMLRQQIRDEPFVAMITGSHYWFGGAYLITKVVEDNGEIDLRVESPRELDMLKENIPEDSLQIEIRGRDFKLAAVESLEGDEEGLFERFKNLQTPCRIVLRTESSSGDDSVHAVNLVNQVLENDLQDEIAALVRAERNKAKAHNPVVDEVEVQFYDGGPCERDEISTCLVMGGSGGFTIADSLSEALELAADRVKSGRARSSPVVGQGVTIANLEEGSPCNGRRGIVELFDEETNKWSVRLTLSAASELVAKENLQLDEFGQNGLVYAFFGYAGWTRAQLLGESARGHWGLCKHVLADILEEPGKRREGLESRLVFAPESEMTERNS